MPSVTPWHRRVSPCLGYLLLLSPTFRQIVAAVPQHWLIGIQTFRILGGVWLARYFAGQLPGLFALPAGIGDVATGMLAPFVAYAWYSGKPYARGAAIVWNLFGMADLVNAVVLGALTNGGTGGIVFPTVLIPVYGVPRAFLIHSYSLIGLLRNISRPPGEPNRVQEYGVTERANWRRPFARKATAGKDQSCHLQFCSESA